MGLAWIVGVGWVDFVEWSVVVVAELGVVDGDGMMEWWNRGMEWWVVAAGGGVVAWRLHQIMSVRIVFRGICDDSEPRLLGGTSRAS